MKSKALAAAVALMSTASVANADWVWGNDNDNFVYNGELMLVAFDDVRKVSVVQDLGSSFGHFQALETTAPHTETFTLDSLFASTFASSVATNVQWSVLSLGYNVNGLGGDTFPPGVMMSASATGLQMTDGDFDNLVNNIQSIFNPNINGFTPGADFSENLAVFGNLSTNAYWGDPANYGTNARALPFVVTVDSTQSAYSYLFMEGTATGDGRDILMPGQWTMNLASGELVYSAVPVPAAVWLLASGLLGLGAVSRRRKA